MAGKIVNLASAAIAKLRGIADRDAHRIVNPSQRPYVPPVDDGQAPEVYIAAVPAGGIPARVGNTLGSADCVLYRAISGALEVMQDSIQTIYNLSTTAISASAGYVAVKRDKWGTWLADPVPTSSAATFSGVKTTLFNGPSFSISMGVNYVVPWPSVDYDSGGYWDGTHPTRITFPARGKYLVGFHIHSTGSHISYTHAWLAADGSAANVVDGSTMGYDGEANIPYLTNSVPVDAFLFGISYVELYIKVDSVINPGQTSKADDAILWAYKMG